MGYRLSFRLARLTMLAPPCGNRLSQNHPFVDANKRTAFQLGISD